MGYDLKKKMISTESNNRRQNISIISSIKLRGRFK